MGDPVVFQVDHHDPVIEMSSAIGVLGGAYLSRLIEQHVMPRGALRVAFVVSKESQQLVAPRDRIPQRIQIPDIRREIIDRIVVSSFLPGGAEALQQGKKPFPRQPVSPLLSALTS